MKYAIKYLSMVLVNAMMIMTFILAPIPGVDNTSYAADSDTEEEVVDPDAAADCEKEEDREDGKPGIYKAGCEFNDDLAKSGLKNHYPEGTKGIIEQFIGAVFALVGVTAFHKPLPTAVAECPAHVAPVISMPIVQAGSLAYLLGEIAANNEFKKGSKIAVDQNFQGKKNEGYDRNEKGEERDESRKKAKENREDNNKQLQAYTSLETIYKHQIKGLKQKIGFATAAEVAFIAAEVIEIEDIISTSAAGEADVASMLALNTSNVAFLTSTAATITLGSLGLCAPLTIAIGAYTASILATDIALAGVAISEVASKEVAVEAQIANLGTSLEPAAFLLAGGASAALSTGTHLTELELDATLGALHEIEAKAILATRVGLISGISAGIIACEAAMATATISTYGISAAAFAAAQAAILTLIPITETIEATRLTPIFCSGTQITVSANLDTPLPLIPALDIKTDSIYPEAGVASLTSPKNLFYVKNIIHNFYHRLAMEKINNRKFESPAKRIAEIASTSIFTEFLVEEAMKRIKILDFEKESRQFYEENLLAGGVNSVLKTLKSQLSLAANANSFKELLNMTIKVAVLYYMMGSTLKNNAFPKPRNRMITWGIMSIINGAIISFDTKSKNNAEERLQTVKDEKRRFAESHMVKTKYDRDKDKKDIKKRETAKGNTAERNQVGDGIMGCAVPKGDGFAPAICPTIVPRSRFSFPIHKAKISSNGSLISNTAGLIGDIGYGASTGQQYSDSSLIEAKIQGLNENKNALVKARDSLRKKIDKLDKEKKSRSGSKFKKVSLSQMQSKFKGLYTGDPTKTGVTNDMASKLGAINLPDIEKLKSNKNKAKTGLLNIPKFQMPSSSKSDFDFDLDDDGGGISNDDIEVEGVAKGEEDLEEFIVDSGEINENENVNIFKLISNRYLNSYPILLDEIKKKAK